MDFLLAILPVLVLFALIVFMRKSVIYSATAALATLLVIAAWWGVPALSMTAAGIRGVFVAIEIILIVASAVFIIEIIRRQKLFEPIERLFRRVASDYRAQTLLVGLGLVFFVEGAAGFGTPAIIAVPLLIALGFKPLHAVAVALIGDTIPVSFGAVGLPITYGVDSTIEVLTAQHAEVTASTIVGVAAMNVLMSMVLAMILVAVIVKLRSRPWSEWVEFLPFAAVSGLAVSLPALGVALFVGPELPSIVGGFVGMILIGLMARRGWLMPKTAKTEEATQTVRLKDIKRAIYPYALLVGLLILTRVGYFGVGEWLQQSVVGNDDIFGTGIGFTVEPFYSVATILILTAAATLVLSWQHINDKKSVFRDVLTRVQRPFVALAVVLVFVQIFINSGSAFMGASMPVVIAESISGVSGGMWPFIAPAMGAMGSFISGSATVSNLVFSGLQYDIALSLDMNPVYLLTLQTVGASAGNMVALHNVVAALAIAGISEASAQKVIRTNLWPLVALLSVVGLMGLFISL